MNIDVILNPSELPALAKRNLKKEVCVVFDVLRATSTFVTALHHGASAVIPVGEISEALKIKRDQPRFLTAGERNGVKIRVRGKEFDFGNSPREFTEERVRGRTIVSTTTNGTRALRACSGAKIVLASAFLNLSATAKFLRGIDPGNVLLVCAGTGENTAFEDVVAAGGLCAALSAGKETRDLSDSARVALAAYGQARGNPRRAISRSENAQKLLAIPELRNDVAFCLRRDVFDLVAAMRGNALTVE